MSGDEPFDIVVVGGGINGAGIARDAAGRGLSVLLCEQNDLACATSSASTKLIHGGLRYLEYFEFRLVREALIEREVLLQAAPHIIRPLRFVLPHEKGLRPAWMVRLGLFLYDSLGGRVRLPKSKGISLREHPAGTPLKEDRRKGFTYADCWVDDARLVVLTARDALEKGAEILVRSECVAARREEGLWSVEICSIDSGERRTVKAKALVNATGPWVTRFTEEKLQIDNEEQVRLVKGSHIVVPKLFEHEDPYIFQNPDRRVIFAIPYEQDFTLIGTTDVDHFGAPGEVAISDEEIDYLCTAVNRYFKKPVSRNDVVWTYAGVRPLYDDKAKNASAATRDYVLDLDDDGQGRAPLLSIFGGKITTCRKLAEHALEKLCGAMGWDDSPWTAGAPLPGGDIPNADFDAFLRAFTTAHPWLPQALARRYARSYGTRAEVLLGGAEDLQDLGEDLGDGLYAAEVSYLVDREWARTAEDVLWRRSKLGLHVSEATKGRLANWLSAHANNSNANAMQRQEVIS